MPRPRKEESSVRGKGSCGTPGCQNYKAPGHFLCFAHVDSIAKVKEEYMQELKSRSRFHG